MTRSLPSLLATLLCAGSLECQVVHGTLYDAETEAAVEGATVALLDVGGVVASVLSDSAGVFLVVAPADGEYRVRAERIGYATTISAPLALAENEPVELEFRLPVRAAVLEAVTVVTRPRARTPGKIVNAQRRARDQGIFLSRAELNAMNMVDLREALLDIEGLALTFSPRRGRSGIPLWDGSYLYSEMGWGCMKMVVNELPFPPPGFRLDEILPLPEFVQAIEVYLTYEEVPELHKRIAWPPGSLTACGLVAVWTQRAW